MYCSQLWNSYFVDEVHALGLYNREASKSLVDVVRNYGATFIFTTSLPPTVMSGATASIRILRSEENRQLCDQHISNVDYLIQKFMMAGVSVEHIPSHIIPAHVGDPALCSSLSDEFIQQFGHYVQAINYPTVQEKSFELHRHLVIPLK